MSVGKAVLGDTDFNGFARSRDLHDLHSFLLRMSRSQITRLRPSLELDLYFDDDMVQHLENHALQFKEDMDYIKLLTGFTFRAIAEGEYQLTLYYENSKLVLARKLFNNLASNKCVLKDLRGHQRHKTRRLTEFNYRIDINCMSKGVLNGGVVNVAGLVYTLMKLGK